MTTRSPADESAPEGTERLVLDAEPARLADAAAFVDRFCARHGIARDDALRLLLVIEELVTNTVVHGRPRARADAITLTLTRAPGVVHILYEDTAAPFDPRPLFARDAEPAVALEPGGFGTRLVGALTHGARYAYEDGRNRLRLALACRADARARGPRRA